VPRWSWRRRPKGADRRGRGRRGRDEPADRFYIIESGAFVVRQAAPDGEEGELRRLGPDDVFGELGLLNEAPRSATVAAVTDGTVLALDGPEFLALVGERTMVRGRLLLYELPSSPPEAA
jgi:CRP-like cAMP-binding protein